MMSPPIFPTKRQAVLMAICLHRAEKANKILLYDVGRLMCFFILQYLHAKRTNVTNDTRYDFQLVYFYASPQLHFNSSVG